MWNGGAPWHQPPRQGMARPVRSPQVAKPPWQDGPQQKVARLAAPTTAPIPRGTVAAAVGPKATMPPARGTVPSVAPQAPRPSFTPQATAGPGPTSNPQSARPFVRAPMKIGRGTPNGDVPAKRPFEDAQGSWPTQATKAPRISAGAPASKVVRKPLDDDEEILQQEDGIAVMAQIVSDWDGMVLSVADISARETDETIASLVQDTQAIASEIFKEDMISMILRDSGYRLTMLIEESATVTGYVVYSYNKTGIDVLQIAVAEGHRGRGLGRCAITWLLEHAKKANLAFISIGCPPEGALFYERCGFKQASKQSDGTLTMCLDVSTAENVTPLEVEASQTATQEEEEAPKPSHVPPPKMGQAAPQLGPPKAGKPGAAVRPPQPAKAGQQVPPPKPGIPGVRPAATVAPKVPDKGRTVAPKAKQGVAAKAEEAGEVPEKGRTVAPKAKQGVAAKAEEAGEVPEKGRTVAPKGRQVAPPKAEEGGEAPKEKGKTVAPPKAKGVTVKPKAKAEPEKEKEVITMTRGAMIMKIFEICDKDGDKALSEQELRTFASNGGFEGTDAEWSKDWKIICSNMKTDAAKGLDLVQFEQVLNEGGAGVYTDEELHTILVKMENEAKAAALAAGRAELVRLVFDACDVDKDEVLSEREMKRVVLHIGFNGTDEEWRQEYADMCVEHKRDPALGINLELFEKLVNDDSASGCYCNNNDLEAALENRIAKEPQKGRTIKPPPKRPVISPRQSITTGLFKALDQDGDGYLNSSEMKEFASLIGFKCDDEKWVKEFALFCEQGQADVNVGVDVKLFQKLIDDRSDAGCYCSDPELKDMLKELNPNAGELSSRGALIKAVFQACDNDGDGRLNSTEMRDFAGYTGFEGNAEAWTKEYTMLCSETGNSVDAGIDMQAFTKLVNDTSERGCYCKDIELATMVSKMNAGTYLGGGGGDAGGGGGNRQLSLTPVSRAAIIRTIFHLCDKDGNKLLNENEMMGFAATAGFKGTPETWGKEYKLVCMRNKIDPNKGLNPARFIQVINTGAAGKYTDNELKAILEKLELQACLDAGASGRSGIIRAVFHACDLDSDGYLNRQEMKNIASHVGFKGTADEWANEYRGMCVDHGADPLTGVDLAMLEALVNDSSESGCYCSDRDLRSVLQSMGETNGEVVTAATPGANNARGELIRSVFKACDLDRDGALDEQEMRTFAYHVGFEGTNAEWSKEFRVLCKEKKASGGIDFLLFEKMVNDASDSGCHCTDMQLQAILTKLDLGFR